MKRGKLSQVINQDLQHFSVCPVVFWWQIQLVLSTNGLFKQLWWTAGMLKMRREILYFKVCPLSGVAFGIHILPQQVSRFCRHLLLHCKKEVWPHKVVCFISSGSIDYVHSRLIVNFFSLLHLFHHGIMPLSCWPGARWFCGGHASFMSMLNSFVHVVMYTYYMIAAMGPEYKVL